ncbi:molybdopterin-guanine dinucleotide biosynthesis protein MobB [Serratia proteamaculans]|jgi:molybdopterin-guanine dinucleotide biosynthesis protein B|uniref:molybdopterin-guanine dinucleotide biosynthesis protein MobB n=1 Tax=Serratia proteamaculans TaxID=28151 RepID=UPI0015A47C26|nr:molybdopterin-guanine dinucleotide biosynthesis protein MobB [Serratia proteamaculans]NWA74639.1 molybdopterin-guanine dinucleotide biosynthesis protein B [Serratia proteamaculans]CAI1191353.1 Molybdopterin-guanine dinucleotide biosynthesis protein B [Serratia proteamaculans]CAI1192047.1 Molybdopterin-guanine dinucleotide biosynthesis protein B [Serratia proteamaculans]CAI1197375.1 Molybdopterin-guanine dinucleotide biosynthesis protein B [Serratia proteamaculans]CAI2007923.1 Molybdopterin-
MNNALPPLLAIAAYSGTGKTTLLKQLIPLLKQRCIRVGLIKHTHHDMDVDTPGKDSYELRKAGADQTLVASDRRWALMTETPEQQSLDLQYLASRFDRSKVDVILVEGFKHEPVSKIILYREDIGRPLEDMLDEFVIAVASDQSITVKSRSLDLNQPESIADFIVKWLKDAA